MPSINPTDQARFQQLLASDPEIQAVTQGVWGTTPVNQRPGDTPKNLEAANHAASLRIGQILASRGVKLPPRTFINPRTMSLEGAHGWAGLPPAAKAAIIAGVAATGVGAAGAMGAFGGGAAAAGGGAGAAGSAAVPSIGVTSGLGAGGFGTVAGTSGAGLAGGGSMAGIGGIAKGLLGTGSTLSKITNAAKLAGPVLSGLSAGSQKGREAQNAAASDAALFNLRERGQNEVGLENRADLELKRKQDARLGQSDSYKKALQAALAMNMQDVGISGVPKGIPVINFTGGARPSAIGPEGRAAAKELNKQAMAKLMAGESYDPMPALERTLPPEYRKPGAFENITGALGLGANAVTSTSAANEQSDFQKKILDAIQKMSGPQQPPPQPPMDPRGASGVTPFTRPPSVAPPLMGRPLNPYEQGSLG